MAGVDPSVRRQVFELLGKGFVERMGVSAVMAIAGAGIEERIPGKDRGLLPVGSQANMAHRVAGRIKRLKLYGLPDPHDIARDQAA